MTNPFAKAIYKLGLVVGFSLICREVLADSSIDLSDLDNAVQGQIKGGFGKLLGFAAVAWAGISIVGRFNVWAIVTPIALLLLIGFGPDIVSKAIG